MPQRRRKVPFSGKQKKLQLLSKKQAKSSTSHNIIRKLRDEESSDISEDSDFPRSLHENVEKINLQPMKDARSRSNRYVLQFHRETGKQLREMKEEARKTLEPCPEIELELSDSYFVGYDFPKRPKWSYEMSKEQLDANENRYFFKYVTYLEKTHYDDMKSLSFCELNLETWRQLWRVLELSDIVLVIVDARYPTLMFPPALYHYVTEDLGKGIILVMNKIDLVEPDVVLAWKRFFEQKYTAMKVVLFTSYPSYNLRGKHENKQGLKIRRRKGRMRMAAEGAQQIFNVCREYVREEVDLSAWHQKLLEERSASMDIDGDDESVEVERTHEEEKDFSFEEHTKYQNGVLTIGCVGFPNVGKSSLLNALMGKKVVSVSRTPGHTKHFQTIFLTNTVRLCDCPGLVFPSSVPRKLQVLMGSYPIAQLREPYASIRFLAERLDLPALLALKHPDSDDVSEEWSAIDVCDAWAIKRGFHTAKAARPDTYRAANSILRMALDGKITLSLKPVGYHQIASRLKDDPELVSIRELQALTSNKDLEDDDDYLSDTDTEDVTGAASNDADNEDDEEGNSTLVPAGTSASNPFAVLGSPE